MRRCNYFPNALNTEQGPSPVEWWLNHTRATIDGEPDDDAKVEKINTSCEQLDIGLHLLSAEKEKCIAEKHEILAKKAEVAQQTAAKSYGLTAEVLTKCMI